MTATVDETPARPIAKRHYKVIVVVLASGDTPCFDQDRRVWRLYKDRHPDIKVLIVYGYPFPNDAGSPDPDSDLYYPDLPASEFPKRGVTTQRDFRMMIHRTIRAMQFVDEHYTYEWFVRTNLSTFWNWSELIAHLDELPSQNCYSGDGPFLDEYLSGYDTIVNGYMVKEFLTHTDSILNDDSLHEDQALGHVFHTIMGAPFLPSRIHFMEHFRTISTREDIRRSILEGMASHADHYRVKNTDDGVRRRREVEQPIFAELLQAIYGITDSFAITVTEEQLQEQAAQLALHDQQQRVIADWIAAHGTPEQRARQAAGMLPMDEAISAMIDDAFAPLSSYQRYVRDDVGRLQAHLSGAPAHAEATIGRGEIQETSGTAARMTPSQLALVEQIKALLPEATVVLRTHTLTWRRMPQVALPPSFGVRVTLHVGPFIFRREYAAAA